MGDEEGFLKSVIEHQNLGGVEEDPLFDNHGSQIVIMGDDFQKMHQNFAGDTFSQISSTYEQQVNMLSNNNNQQQQQQSQNECVRSKRNSKLYSYQEKNANNKQQNNDELLDSGILNNLNEDMNTPKETNRFLNVKGNGANQIIDFQFFNNAAFASAHSHLSQPHRINSRLSHCNIMNSENLQQSEIQSTMTIYNSGIFDDASIMRILDKSISDDSLLYNLPQQDESGQPKILQQSQLKSGIEVEQSFKFECEDVKQILVNVSSKLKEKLQKQRSSLNQQQSYLIAISVEELKQFEILTSSAIEKIRQIQATGKHITDSFKVKELQFKNQKQSIKIQIHNQIQKFKDICKKQYQQAERQKFKYQINEFEMNEKIKNMEERFERQSDDINKLANKCEQLKYEKSLITQKYDERLKQVDSLLNVVLNQLSAQSNQNTSKVNNSFCLGKDHSMLLMQPKQKKRMQMLKKHQNDIQQSFVEEKENESILSNKISSDKEIQAQLLKIKKLVSSKINSRKVNRNNHQHQQEGGSGCESSSMFNLIGELNNDIQRDSLIQQSQYIPEEESQADVNQAFIQSQDDSSSMSSAMGNQYPNNGKFIDIEEDLEENDQSVEFKFDKNQVLVVMDGMNEDNMADQSKGSIQDLMLLDDKILTKDLKGIKKQAISESQKIALEQQRQKMFFQKGNQQFDHQFFNNSIENSLEDDLNILQNLSREEQKKHDNHMFPVDLSGIENSINLINTNKGGINFESGRNIFIADEFGGSLELNSRNDDKLYSGGSSQLSMMQAFQSLRHIKQPKEIFVLRVQDRKINIPKLNLKGVCDYSEPFKGNIFSNVSDEMSILTESQIAQSAKSIMQPMNVQLEQANVNSFQNESISKQYHFENTDESIQQPDLLDKAICIENSKINYSSESHKEVAGAPVPFNIFDSFKKELSNMDKSKMDISNGNQQHQKPHDDTLNLDDSDDFGKDQNNDQVKFNEHFNKDLMKIAFKSPDKKELASNQQDKSGDISLNISRFKQSLSDPNLLFNNVDSDEESERNKDTTDSKNHKNPIEEFKQPFSHNLKLKFNQIKTPQNVQGKLKFALPSTDPFHQQNSQVQQPSGGLNIKNSLGQYQTKIRSNSGNSRKNTDSAENQSNQQHQQKLNGMKKIQKINIIHKKEKSRIEERADVDSSMMVMMPNKNASVLQHPQSPKLHSINEDGNNSKIIKRIINKPKYRREDPPQVDDQISSQGISSEANSSLSKPQLIQNYMVSAAIMQGSNSQVGRSNTIKIIKPKSTNLTRNQIVVKNNSSLTSHQQDQLNESVDRSNILPIKLKINSNMMQQMKEYQESQDLSVNHGILRRTKKVIKHDSQSRQDDDENVTGGLSPSQKTPQKVSQSDTPQKKNIIIVNKQLIKQNQKKINISQIDMTQNDIPPHQIQQLDNQPQQQLYQSLQQQQPSQKPTTINIKKISLTKRRGVGGFNYNTNNITVINQSIDQSQIYSTNNHQNASIMIHPNIDNSLMLNDISSINYSRVLPTKIMKAKVKQMQIDASANENSTQSNNTSIVNNLANKKRNPCFQQIIQKVKNQQQQLPQYTSNQSEKVENKSLCIDQNDLISITGDKNYQSNQVISSNTTADAKRPDDSSNNNNNKIQKRRRDIILKANLNHS